MVGLYRAALRIRRETEGLGDGPMRWLDSPEGVLAFTRGEAFACVVNLSAEGFDIGGLPADYGVLLSSIAPTPSRVIPSDAAVWLRLRNPSG